MVASFVCSPLSTVAYVRRWSFQDTVYSLVTTNSVIDVVFITLIKYHCIVELVDVLISPRFQSLRSPALTTRVTSGFLHVEYAISYRLGIPTFLCYWSVEYILQHSDIRPFLLGDWKTEKSCECDAVAVPLSMPVLGYHGIPILAGSEEKKLKKLKEERIMCLWRSSQRRRVNEKEKVYAKKEKPAVPDWEMGEPREREEERTMVRVLGDECCCSHYSVFVGREEVEEDKKSV